MKYPNPYELQSIDAYRIVDNFLYISQKKDI